MRYLITISTILILNSCAKELHLSQTRVVDLGNNSQSLEEHIGPYSSIFEGTGEDGNIEIEFYDDGLGTIGVYLWDKYKNNIPDSANFSIGSYSFDATVLGPDKISFVPENRKPYRYETSSSWVEEDFNRLEGKTVDLELRMDSETILSEKINVSPFLEFNVFGESTNEIIRSNVRATWNKDRNNENGLLIFIRSSGVNSNDVFGAPSQGISKLLVLEDDGEEILPESIFDGLSSGSYVNLLIWRGPAFSIVATDGGLFKILVASRSIVSGVLVD